MLEHDDAGNAVTSPPPPLVVVSPPPSLFPPPPQPAAANASAAKRPTSATALKLLFTLPPPSPVCAILGVRSGQYPACARQIANESGRAVMLVPWRRAEVAELADAPDSKSGARKGVWVRFPPSAPGSLS